jgi:hypothetical protein
MILAAIMLAVAQSSAAAAVWTENRSGTIISNGDYTSCPYETLAQVKRVVRPDFIWSKGPDRGEAVAIMTSEALTLGADAVLFVTIGKPHMSLIKINAVTIRGRAVRFTDRSCRPTPPSARTEGPLVVPMPPQE